MVAVLSCVGTTASELSTTPVGLGEYPERNPDRHQSPMPWPMLCGRHPEPRSDGKPLSWSRPRSGCDPAGGSGLHAHLLAARNLP